MRELKPKSTLSGQKGGLRDGAAEFCHRSVPMVTTTHLITKLIRKHESTKAKDNVRCAQ